MSDFCLLAASLLSQGQLRNWQLAVHPPTQPEHPSARLDRDTEQLCQSSAKEIISDTEVHHPEFSQQNESQILNVQSTAASILMTDVTRYQIRPKPAQETPAPQRSFASNNGQSTSNGRSPQPLRPITASQPAASSELAATPPRLTYPLPASSPPRPIAAVTPYPTRPINSPRPASGSQLYHQRLAALRAGTMYTRLPANSFYPAWINATRQPTHEQWLNLLAQEARVMARGQGNNRLTVVIGDSLSLWIPSEQLPMDRFWLNQGISGDTSAGVLRRLSAFSQTRPSTIHVMVGVNDLRRGASDEEVLANLRQIMRRLRQNHPQAQVFVHSVLPTRLAAIPGDRIYRINQQLAAIAQQEEVNYTDLLTTFADGNGNLRQELTTDGLHLNPLGYATWQLALQ